MIRFFFHFHFMAQIKDRVQLLREACQRHQRGYQDAMCGKGIDRHLFCLYVLSKYFEIDSPFLNEVLSEPWRLSTSQTPLGQTNKLDLNKYPQCISAGGEFLIYISGRFHPKPFQHVLQLILLFRFICNRWVWSSCR